VNKVDFCVWRWRCRERGRWCGLWRRKERRTASKRRIRQRSIAASAAGTRQRTDRGPSGLFIYWFKIAVVHKYISN